MDLLLFCVHVAPNIAPQHRQEESDKFILLGNTDHNVEIFFQKPMLAARPMRLFPSVFFPPLPHVFIGREVLQYNVLQGLRSSRLVKINGSKGIGKADLVKACCWYLNYRLHMVEFQEILWVPYQEEIRKEEPFCHFQQIFYLIKNASLSWKSFVDAAVAHLAKLAQYYSSRKTLLVIDAKKVTSKDGLSKLSTFLEEFIKVCFFYFKFLFYVSFE